MKTKTAEEILMKYDIPRNDWQFETIRKAMEEYAKQFKDRYPDTEADGYVFCGKCGKMKEI